MRRLASPRRAAVVLTLAIAASVALSGQSSAVNAASSTSFQPLADSYVSKKNPSKNFGAETRLYIRTGPIMRSYLRFSVSGLPANATVASATLQLYSPSGSPTALEVHRVANTSWGEGTITFNNAPAFDAPVTASSGLFPAGQWLSLDVTPLVAGNGALSLALTSTSKTTSSLASREDTAFAPFLLVETTVPADVAPTNTSPPAVLGNPQPSETLTAQPGAWTGTQPIDYTYQWQRCQADGSSCTDLADADDPSYVVAPDDAGNTLRVSVTATNGAGSATAVSAATGLVGESDPVIAAAGDIACDPPIDLLQQRGGNRDGLPPAAHVRPLARSHGFPGPDCCVAARGSSVQERRLHEVPELGNHSSWGRPKAITIPVPGNDEYVTAGAAGYDQYFKLPPEIPPRGTTATTSGRGI